jgi:hypothetical protein
MLISEAPCWSVPFFSCGSVDLFSVSSDILTLCTVFFYLLSLSFVLGGGEETVEGGQ